MDRRQYTDTIQFFSQAKRVYEALGDNLVAEECSFAIALAQRIMTDAERNRPKKQDRVKEISTAFEAECATAKVQPISVD
jgi:hypothetical protein